MTRTLDENPVLEENPFAAVAILLVPSAERVSDLIAWAEAEAAAFAELGAIRDDEASRYAFALLLMGLAGAQCSEGFSWRYLLVAGPETTPLPIEVGFRPADAPPEAIWDAMIGVELPAAAGRHVATIEMNGRIAKQCIRMELREPDQRLTVAVGELWATMGAVCRRELPPGTTDVLLAADTADVDLLFALLPVLHDILTGDMIVEDVQRALQAEGQPQ